MEIEQKQAEIIGQLVDRASKCSGESMVLPYDNLMVELDVTNVRQLEDFLNNECMYDGIVRGKLDQLKRCFEVPFAAGRDPRPGELGDMLHALSNL
uniref:PCI domain-containing protein n=1 Tax=Brassica campestris TaxID=3711 RepID=M4EWN5_BRACM